MQYSVFLVQDIAVFFDPEVLQPALSAATMISVLVDGYSHFYSSFEEGIGCIDCGTLADFIPHDHGFLHDRLLFRR